MLLLSDRYPKRGKLPVHALLATGAVHHHLVARGPALRRATSRRDRHRARSASFRLPDRLRRDRGVSLPRLPDPVRPGRGAATLEQARQRVGSSAAATGAASARACSRSCRRWASRTIAQLSRRAAVRDRRPARRSRVELCFTGTRQPHPGRGVRRPQADQQRARDARVGRRAAARSRAACSSTCTAASTTCYNPDVVAHAAARRAHRRFDRLPGITPSW